MTKRHMTKGFTLVELSIVLVIIGLIIGGVLTGQQVIQNARISNTINGIQAFQAQLQTYAQNFGALPGDDPSAAARFSSAGVAQCSGTGCGDGAIGTNASFDAASDAAGSALESRHGGQYRRTTVQSFRRHLRFSKRHNRRHVHNNRFVHQQHPGHGGASHRCKT
jgi:prepilin-type N-terminal cleavage/methylation domain-containing protein